jgi:hypothetical protein
MNQKNPIVKATFIVFGTIWIAMNLYTLFTDPVWFWENIPNMIHGAYITFVGCVMGVLITAGLILLERSLAQMKLQGGSFNGVLSSIGPVPILAPPARRAKAKECLPIESERVKQWIEANKNTNPAYVNLFMAVWQTLSAHKTHPASHRKGGHGGRTLAQHCMAVADTALELAPGWTYDGVYIKRPGKSPKLIVAKRDASYVFDPLDPIIPVLALAHDLGKIEAYKLQADGSVLTSESDSEQDHAGVKHDRLGARILARITEFWELSPMDTRTLSRVIAHYHHPSDFPVDKDGLSIDDRMTALMEFLILADKTTGQRESGISASAASEDTISETEAEEIYAAFVACVTEKGRINGTGDREIDKTFKIGQKHAGLIYLRDGPLLAAICRKLGVSIEAGSNRFILLNRVLQILEDKGLLYSSHNGVHFKEYLPLFLVRFYHSESTSVIADWHQTIVIKPTAKHADLVALFNMPALVTVAKVEAPYFSHLNNFPDPAKLIELVRNAFGDEVLLAVEKGMPSIRFSQTSEEQKRHLIPPTGAAAAIPIDTISEPAPTSQKNQSESRSPSQPILNSSNAGNTIPLVSMAAQISNPIHLSAVADPESSNQNIDWKNLDEEVKKNGFDTVLLANGELSTNLRIDDLADLPIIDTNCEDIDHFVSEANCDISMDDVDLVAGVKGQEGCSAINSDLANSPENIEAGRVTSTSELTLVNNESSSGGNQTLGIPQAHDTGTTVQDVPKDPVSNYKKQKQADRNSENLANLQRNSNPQDFLHLLSSSKSKKQRGNGLSAYLGAGNDLKALLNAKSVDTSPETEHSAPGVMDEVVQQKAYLVFQKLIHRAIESSTLHCLATIDDKHFVLQSMIENAFPDANVDERLPAAYVERRTTRAGTVLIIPAATTRNG